MDKLLLEASSFVTQAQRDGQPLERIAHRFARYIAAETRALRAPELDGLTADYLTECVAIDSAVAALIAAIH